MTYLSGQRSLADLIVELSQGLGLNHLPLKLAGQHLRPVSAEFRLPVETGFVELGGEPALVADLPRTRTRTAFDRPHGTLLLTLVTEPCP